jgi:hypothetical protein
VQYLFAGQGKAKAIGEAYPAAEKIAEGILRLAGMAESGTTLRRRRYCHRTLLQLLESNAASQAHYKAIAFRFALRQHPLTPVAWHNRWRAVVQKIAEVIAGVPLSSSEADDFLAWKDQPDAEPSASNTERSRHNIYRYPNHDPKVDIRVGSIHSIKGETHTATLVLDTFYYAHNLVQLKPWICGHRSGWKKEDGQQSRLKIHYVAMTRPTHLLCLAMKRDAFENSDGQLDEKLLRDLEHHGWHIEEL